MNGSITTILATVYRPPKANSVVFLTGTFCIFNFSMFIDFNIDYW